MPRNSRGRRYSKIEIADAGGFGGNVIEIACEAGTFNYTLPEEKEVIQDRDVNDHVRLGPDGVSRISFSMIAETVADGNAASGSISPYEAMTFTGGAAAWVKEDTNSDAVGFQVRFTTTDTAGSNAETITFTDCYTDGDWWNYQEGSPANEISVSIFSLNTKPTIA